MSTGRETEPGRAGITVAVLHPLRTWVDALEAVLGAESELDVVVAHTDLPWVRQEVGRQEVDVVLVGLDAPAAAARTVVSVRHQRPEAGVVVMSDHEDSRLITAVVRAGARGFVAQSCSLEELLAAVHAVDRGETWIRPSHVSKLIEGLLAPEPSDPPEHDQLTPLSEREREILGFLALGMRRQEIAERLFLSPNTVRTHINHVLRKLDVHSTLAAVSMLRDSQETPGEAAVPRRAASPQPRRTR